MLTPIRSAQFKRDVKRVEKRGKSMDKLRALVLLLIEQKPPPPSRHDHALKGDWKGNREIHIEADWLLINRVVGDELRLARTGTHADLFKE